MRFEQAALAITGAVLMSSGAPATASDPAEASGPEVMPSPAEMYHELKMLRAEVADLRDRESGSAAVVDEFDARRAEEVLAMTDRVVADANARSWSDEVAEDGTPKPKWVDVLDRMTVYGDIRFREEYTFDVPGADDRNRFRMRVRLRLDYELTDELQLGFGIRTGTRTDPNSPYVTLGDGFDDFEVSIDIARATWRPEGSLDGFWLTGGKFTNPIDRNPVYGELVWDADVNPEGVVAGYTMPTDGFVESFEVLVGGYTVLEDSQTDDVYMLAVQGAANVRLGEDLSGMAALAYYYYSNPTPDGSNMLLADNAGNAVIDTTGDGIPDEYVSNFGILNPVVAVTYEGWEGLPLTVSGEYIYNTRARISGDKGWAVGASLGKTKKKDDWRVYYQFQVVEQDAVFSAFAQDDFVYQTNLRGHVFGGTYMFADDIGLHLWALVARQDDTLPGVDDDYAWRLRADLTIQF